MGCSVVRVVCLYRFMLLQSTEKLLGLPLSVSLKKAKVLTPAFYPGLKPASLGSQTSVIGGGW